MAISHLRPERTRSLWRPPFFHNFTPGFQPAPPLLWLKDPGVKGAFRKVEWCWVGAREPVEGRKEGEP